MECIGGSHKSGPRPMKDVPERLLDLDPGKDRVIVVWYCETCEKAYVLKSGPQGDAVAELRGWYDAREDMREIDHFVATGDLPDQGKPPIGHSG